MIFFKNIILSLLLIFLSLQNVFADNHDSKGNLVEEAKKITEDIKSKQNAKEANIKSEIDEEEDVPLNDPFAGDTASGSISTTNANLNETEERSQSILYSFKLVGIITGESSYYVSLANNSGEIINLKLFDELEEGLKLVDMRLDEAIFQKAEDKEYMIINFNNQIIEKDEY